VPRTLFDFGREVTGYLHFDVEPGVLQQAGLLYTGTERVPDLLGTHPDGAVIPLPARAGWGDACPRRFRYALVVGLPVRSARLQPLDPSQAEALLALPEPERRRGVLGIPPPPLRTPVETEVGRKLQHR
jgi:hypothetical protein